MSKNIGRPSIPKIGRPSIPLPELDELEKLCNLNPTLSEIAAFFRVSSRTAVRWLKHKHVKELVERGRNMGKLSLRRSQRRLADAGNPAMNIWLGKIELGQKDPGYAVQLVNMDALSERLMAGRKRMKQVIT